VYAIARLPDHHDRHELRLNVKNWRPDCCSSVSIRGHQIRHRYARHDDRYWAPELFKTRIHPRGCDVRADWMSSPGQLSSELKPRKDMIATDGQKLTLGDTTITLYITPGHTPGTISLIFR